MKRQPIIITALVIALLMAVQSIVSYSLESRRVESLMKHEMDDAEDALHFFLLNVYDAAEEMVRLTLSSLDNPDELFDLADRLLLKYDDLSDCYIGFVPDFFPQKGRLYAPCAYWQGDSVIVHSQFGNSLDYTGRDWYTGAMTGDSDGFWSTVYVDPDLKQPVITHSVKVLFPNGEPIGVVGVDVDAEWLRLTMEGCRPDDDISCRLFNAEGALLMEVGPKMKGEVSHDKHLVLETTLSPIDTKLIISVPKSSIWKKVVWVSLFTSIILLGSILMLMWLVMRYLRDQKSLAKAETEQEGTRREMRIANTIQMSMLPRHNYRRDDVLIQGSLTPAREIGGDMYDYFIRDGKLFFCIGDVSGKGVPSAMLMSVAHSVYRMIAGKVNSPARILQEMNGELCRNNESNMFLTFFMGCLDLYSGVLTYGNAGHDKPFILSGEVSQLDAKANLPLGVFPDRSFEEQQQTLAPGTTLVLYTDGLTEAKNLSRKQFGLEAVRMVLEKSLSNGNISPAGLVSSLGDAARSFAGDAPQSDDLTLLVVRFEPQNHVRDSITLGNNIADTEQLSLFVKGFCSRIGLGKSLTTSVRLALEEAVVNVMQYAYPAGERGSITILADSNHQEIRFSVIDSGFPFNPTTVMEADTTNDAELRPIGGLGIHLLRELMDSISYERKNRQNILTMTKII